MAADTSERWIDGLQYSSLFWPPPQDLQQRKVRFLLSYPFTLVLNKFTYAWLFCMQAQITAYVDYFAQFTSDQFPEDIAEVLVFHVYHLFSLMLT